jgi:MFS-type transporter involved in bile tolerance (Atg22 family)
MSSELAIMPEKPYLQELETVPESTRTFQIDVGVFIDVDDVAITEDIAGLDSELEQTGKRKFLAAKFLKRPQSFIWFLASFASIGGFLFGVDQSLISGAALYIPLDLNLGKSEMSMIVGFTPLGAMFGALILMPTNDLFGRKWTISISSILFTVGAILEAVAQEFGVLLAGRLVLGVALGLLSGTVPAYISENCAVRWRGGLVSL